MQGGETRQHRLPLRRIPIGAHDLLRFAEFRLGVAVVAGEPLQRDSTVHRTEAVADRIRSVAAGSSALGQ